MSCIGTETGSLILKSSKMRWFYILTLICVSFGVVKSLESSSCNQEECGEVLFLTPILEAGNLDEARNSSKVIPGIGGVDSFSGFLTVNKQCQSNLFFWFFPAKNNSKLAPVVLWLQGGPGSSSLFGLFKEIGPLSFEDKLTLSEFSWNEKNNLLFIDQPAGTGFSFTGRDCYATNETQVSEELYSALVQFFQLFPELKENRFFIAGESYAGYYIPAIGYKIHHSNRGTDPKINLQGMLIGNGLMDIDLQGDNYDHLYYLGFIDFNEKEASIPYFKYNTKRNSGCFTKYRYGYEEYNYLNLKCKSLDVSYPKFLDLPSVRKSIHVGKQQFINSNGVVYKHLFLETTQIKPLVEELLEHYPMVFYNGQLDLLCPYTGMVKFLRALSWSGAEEYERARRHQWCDEDVLAGYYKSAGNLHEVLVRAAGHMVPQDQPSWALSIVNSVTSNPPNNPLAGLSDCSVQQTHGGS